MKKCPLSDRCGGCCYSGVPYEKQLQEKQKLLIRCLGKFGTVAPIIGMKDPLCYRTKVQAVFSKDRTGKVVSGNYSRGTHRIVPVKECALEDPVLTRILSTIRSLVTKIGITVYDEDTHYGFLRHVLLKRSAATGEVMVVLVAGTTRFPKKHEFVTRLVQLHPEIKSVLFNLNCDDTSMVLSDEPVELLYGRPYIEDVLLGLKFRISAKSFYQVNHTQAERLYKVAVKMAQLTGKEAVVDAYCGTGTIGLYAAANGAESLLGIELSPEAVEDARINAEENGIKNASFIEGDASEVLKNIYKSNNIAENRGEKDKVFRPDVVFLDPPRNGSTEQFLSALIHLSPKRIVYVSCNPLTLERDLRYITGFSDYRVAGIQGVDMFPMTEHVETVVVLGRQRIDSHISIDLDVSKISR